MNRNHHIQAFRESFINDERGSVLVEFAVISSLLLLLLVLSTDMMLCVMTVEQTNMAGRAAAQYAATYGLQAANISNAGLLSVTYPLSTISIASSSYCGCGGASAGSASVCATISCSDGSPAGSYIRVTSSSEYFPITPRIWATVMGQSTYSYTHSIIVRNQ